MRFPRLLSLLVLLLAASAVPARAQSAQAHLAWNDARAQGGLATRTFDCAADTGSSEFVITLVPATDLPGVTNVIVTLQVYPVPWANCDGCDAPCNPPPAPPWWEFFPGGARAGGFSASAKFPAAPSGGASAVRDPWGGEVSVSAAAAQRRVASFGASWIAELLTIEIVPRGREPVNLRAGQEYYIACGIVSHGAAAGGAGVADCCAPASVLLQTVQVRDADRFTAAIEGSDAPIGWNTGHFKCAAVRSRHSVWGARMAPERPVAFHAPASESKSR